MVPLRLSSTSTTEAIEEDLRGGEECIDAGSSSDKLASTLVVKQTRKKVRFFANATVQVHLVKKWESVDHPNIWFSSKEIEEIRKDCRFTVKCLSNENMMCFLTDDNETKYCGRGLENKTPSGQKLRAVAKTQAREAVLDEQWSQWYGGIYDEEAMAEKYSKFAHSSERLARIFGLRDECAVKRMK